MYLHLYNILSLLVNTIFLLIIFNWKLVLSIKYIQTNHMLVYHIQFYKYNIHTILIHFKIMLCLVWTLTFKLFYQLIMYLFIHGVILKVIIIIMRIYVYLLHLYIIIWVNSLINHYIMIHWKLMRLKSNRLFILHLILK